MVDVNRYLDNNQFSGRIPNAFYKHPLLKELWVVFITYYIQNHKGEKKKQISNPFLLRQFQVYWRERVPARSTPHWWSQGPWTFGYRFLGLILPSRQSTWLPQFSFNTVFFSSICSFYLYQYMVFYVNSWKLELKV